jgi:hypothetical protein
MTGMEGVHWDRVDGNRVYGKTTKTLFSENTKCEDSEN